MATRLFIDTSAFIALEEADDENHARAREFSEELKSGVDRDLFTSSYVFAELMAWFSHCPDKKVDLGGKLREGRVQLEWVDREVEEAAWKLLLRDSHQPFSLTDCTTFVLMERLKIWELFTFNPELARLGRYRILPGGTV